MTKEATLVFGAEARLMGARRSRAWLVLAAVCLGQLALVLTFQAAGLVLPAMTRDLGLTTAAAQWVVSANALVFGGFLLLGGRAADRFGHRRLFVAGLVVFAAGSLGCGLAPGVETLVIARGAQGLGTALFAPASLALLADAFPEGLARNRALGIWGAAGPLGGVVSVLLGGAMADVLGWRSIFLLGAFLAIPPLVLALFASSDHRERDSITFHPWGAALGTAGIAALIYGFGEASRAGLYSSWGAGFLAGGVTLLAGFALIEWRASAPLIPRRLLSRPGIAATNLIAFLHGASTNTSLVFFALFTQQIQGGSVLATGIGFLPCNLGVIGGSLVAARGAGRFGFARVMAVGMATIVFGLLLLTAIAREAAYVATLLPGLTLMGFGLGVAQVGIIGMATGVEPGDRGISTGLVSSSAQVGTAVGLALMLAAANAQAEPPDMATTVEGIRSAFRLGAGLALVGCAIAVLVAMRERRRAGSGEERDDVTLRTGSAPSPPRPARPARPGAR